eukprot:scaffold35778_cov25-Prasinocladus_malaysianus.AAC.1
MKPVVLPLHEVRRPGDVVGVGEDHVDHRDEGEGVDEVEAQHRGHGVGPQQAAGRALCSEPGVRLGEVHRPCHQQHAHHVGHEVEETRWDDRLAEHDDLHEAEELAVGDEELVCRQ